MRWRDLEPVDLFAFEGAPLLERDGWTLFALDGGGLCLVERGAPTGPQVLEGRRVVICATPAELATRPDVPSDLVRELAAPEGRGYLVRGVERVTFFGTALRVYFEPPGNPVRHDFGLYRLSSGAYLGWTQWHGRGARYSAARVFVDGSEFGVWARAVPVEFLQQVRRWSRTAREVD